MQQYFVLSYKTYTQKNFIFFVDSKKFFYYVQFLMTTISKKQIEFCYHIKNRWPHHIKNKKQIDTFQKMVFDAIQNEIDLLDDEDIDWKIFTHENSSLDKFNRHEQILLLNRLKKALVENNHSFDEEDLILEETLYRVVTGYYEYISDCKKDYKKEWNRLKKLAGSDDEDEVKDYYMDSIWHDMDFEIWQIRPSHIKNYKKILKEYI